MTRPYAEATFASSCGRHFASDNDLSIALVTSSFGASPNFVSAQKEMLNSYGLNVAALRATLFSNAALIPLGTRILSFPYVQHTFATP